ncbi:MAG: D-alanyl-D-alanine carboxypeptidase family protein [Hyphomicrobiaceae bacterium]
MARLSGLAAVLSTGLMTVSHLAAPAHAGPALLLEAESGQVLYSDDPDQPWYPASLTKMMTAYLTFEALKSGKVKPDDEVPLSRHARGQPATRIGLRAGIKLTYDGAVRGMILRSANDFAVALAEALAGSEEAFAERMNATAKRLGMTRTKFRNPHGLPDDGQVSTARDMAKLTLALSRDFPHWSEVFSSHSVRIHKGTFYNQNDILRTLEGADGMKTGFTCGSGYNIVASATRDGHRLIAVVLGEQTRVKRSQRVTALIEHGFAVLGWKQLAAQPIRLATLELSPDAAEAAPDTSSMVRIGHCPFHRPAKDTATVASATDRPAAAVRPPATVTRGSANLAGAVPNIKLNIQPDAKAVPGGGR